jgi:hypothetical protein
MASMSRAAFSVDFLLSIFDLALVIHFGCELEVGELEWGYDVAGRVPYLGTTYLYTRSTG